MSDTQPTGGAPQVPARDQAEAFIDRAKGILEDLLEVKVVTAIGSVTVDLTTDDDATKTSLKTLKPLEDTIVTVIKVTDGDVTTVIADSLQANADLRAFHTDQVTKSLTMLPDNLRKLVDIAKALLDMAGV